MIPLNFDDNILNWFVGTAITFMKIRVLLAVLLVGAFGQLPGQTNDSVEVHVSHIFFCVDSVTYKNLFEHEFLAKMFANASESSSKTLTDSWTGKYLNGRQSYIEVFASNYKAKTRLGKPNTLQRLG